LDGRLMAPLTIVFMRAIARARMLLDSAADVNG
jgi:hypothetical protein